MKMRKIKCFYCSKVLRITEKGLIPEHIVHKGRKCVGSGQPVRSRNKYLEEKR